MNIYQPKNIKELHQYPQDAREIEAAASRRTIVPWQLNPITLLTMSVAAALESVALFFTNEQVKAIIYAKLTGHRITQLNQVRPIQINKVTPNHTELKPVQKLPSIY
ncbi:unnamed protein product [Adineta ricciae]|uniref:Uncharacterized protein n=1 Tax=Adineta ricciae TaxID=249248 RepID=A0A816C116_ADIRI|nr:unnamed protein product [Adineta ricciae]